MNDALNVDLQDPELDAEIQLVAELMVAAARSRGPLAQSAVDEILSRAADGPATTRPARPQQH